MKNIEWYMKYEYEIWMKAMPVYDEGIDLITLT